MKVIMIAGEYLLGFLLLLVTLLCIAIGFVVSLFELPRYFRLKSK
jgi:hypothetical protein